MLASSKAYGDGPQESIADIFHHLCSGDEGIAGPRRCSCFVRPTKRGRAKKREVHPLAKGAACKAHPGWKQRRARAEGVQKKRSPGTIAPWDCRCGAGRGNSAAHFPRDPAERKWCRETGARAWLPARRFSWRPGPVRVTEFRVQGGDKGLGDGSVMLLSVRCVVLRQYNKVG